MQAIDAVAIRPSVVVCKGRSHRRCHRPFSLLAVMPLKIVDRLGRCDDGRGGDKFLTVSTVCATRLSWHLELGNGQSSLNPAAVGTVRCEISVVSVSNNEAKFGGGG